MTRDANISCLECRGEYLPTEERGIFECRNCGHVLNQVEFVEETAEIVRGYDGLEDIADWLDEQAEQLAEETNA